MPPRLTFALALLLGPLPAAAVAELLWLETGAASRPARARSYQVPWNTLGPRLDRAWSEPAADAQEISLPLPDGRIVPFSLRRSALLGPAVRRAHPELQSFELTGIDDRALSGRLERTPYGLRAIVFTAQGTVLFDPLDRNHVDEIMVYRAADDRVIAPFDCEVSEAGPAAPRGAATSLAAAGDSSRTYRFILVGTGEYTQALGGVAPALAEMTTAMSRINALFQRDAAVSFEVVQLAAFEDPASDPYPTGINLLNRNRAVVDSMFGTEAYDATQVVSITAGYAGVAFRPLFCFEGIKGESSVSGPDPTSNHFQLHVMPHEIGHTLGATHTQDRTCNRAAATAVEVGSGLTIMSSLGGACPVEIQPFADPFFHVVSIEQMDTTLRAPCGVPVASGNTPPAVDAGPDLTIPRGTAFTLQGSGSDPDPGDALLFTWEQVDRAATTADPLNGPLFRWRPPTPTPDRTFPAWATILSGASDPFEPLPPVDRTLRFRLVARDQHAGSGRSAWDERIVTVSGPPFVLASPNGGESFVSGIPFPVTWSVGGGTSAAHVNIDLTTDGGATWVTLAANVPNDGADVVAGLVAVTRTTCRIRVAAVDAGFFDVSNADFTLVEDVTPALLALLSAESTPDGILIRWRFADSSPFTRVIVERAAVAAGPWAPLAGEAIEGVDATSFLDGSPLPDRDYHYRLAASGAGGIEQRFGPIVARRDGIPERAVITSVAPNPAGPDLRIAYALPAAGHARLRILDVQGRTAATLFDGPQGPGRFQTTWRTTADTRLAPGLYFVRLDRGEDHDVRRIVIAK